MAVSPGLSQPGAPKGDRMRETIGDVLWALGAGVMFCGIPFAFVAFLIWIAGGWVRP